MEDIFTFLMLKKLKTIIFSEIPKSHNVLENNCEKFGHETAPPIRLVPDKHEVNTCTLIPE